MLATFTIGDWGLGIGDWGLGIGEEMFSGLIVGFFLKK
jgi:hypothetical protein